MTTDFFGLIVAILGLICVVASTVLNFFIMNHGSSGQLVIDEYMKRVLWPILTGIILMVFGFVIWIQFSVSEHKYIGTFALAFSSYVVSMFAVLFSLYQVNVTTN